jgi:hypothetical protein
MQQHAGCLQMCALEFDQADVVTCSPLLLSMQEPTKLQPDGTLTSRSHQARSSTLQQVRMLTLLQDNEGIVVAGMRLTFGVLVRFTAVVVDAGRVDSAHCA